jgi:hypothetical protein
MTQYLDKWQAAKRFRISTDTMKRYRRSGVWIENIHWVKYNSRCIRYNDDSKRIKPPARSRQIDRANPSHAQAIVQALSAQLPG